ncbi:hypothetical protein [Methylocaldum szegediense]|nr:hypothetical protein [Methylocaldum szegediense]
MKAHPVDRRLGGTINRFDLHSAFFILRGACPGFPARSAAVQGLCKALGMLRQLPQEKAALEAGRSVWLERAENLRSGQSARSRGKPIR